MRPTSLHGGLIFHLMCVGILLGCQKSASPTVPTSSLAPTTPVTVSFGPGESIPAMFEVTIDPATMSATSRPLIVRTATGFQASQFDLDITKFQTSKQFNVRSVEFTRTRNLEITFRHEHPWGPVDISQPPSATNRADLSYTGRLLILADLQPADIPSHTFFGDVRANTDLVIRPDAYIQPGDLLAKSGFTANCFPYVLLADELEDNRIGISNNGVMTGNWDPAVGGWQRSNLGPTGDGWTGYDFVHAGQTIENSFVLNADELTGGPLTLQVALLIKYTEPKGVGGEVGRTLRLPPVTVDVLQFAYRAPHAALDCSRVQFLDGQLTNTEVVQVVEQGGTIFYNEHDFKAADVRDWDAAAPEAGTPDISTNLNISAIEPGTSSGAIAAIDDTENVLDSVSEAFWTGVGSGVPGNIGANELVFHLKPTSALDSSAVTDSPALMRLQDPESLIAPGGSPHFGVDPVSLIADSSRAVDSVTYFPFLIRIVPTPPIWNTHLVDASTFSGRYSTVAVLENDPTDPADDRLAIAYQVDAGPRLRFARALVPAPTSEADWVVMQVDAINGGGYDCELLWANGRPSIAHINRTTKELRIAHATKGTPDGPLDWSNHVLASGLAGTEDHVAAIVDEAGLPVVAFHDGTLSALRLAHALMPQAGPADWRQYTLYAPLPIGLGNLSMDRHDARLQLLAAGIYPPDGSNPDPSGAVFWTENAAPIQGDWSGYKIPSDQGVIRLISAGWVMGGPGIFWSSDHVPMDPEDWTGLHPEYVPASGAIIEIDNWLTLCDDSALTFARQLVVDPRYTSDWQIFQIGPFGATSARRTSMIAVQGRHVVSAQRQQGASGTGHLMLAWNQTPW